MQLQVRVGSIRITPEYIRFLELVSGEMTQELFSTCVVLVDFSNLAVKQHLDELSKSDPKAKRNKKLLDELEQARNRMVKEFLPELHGFLQTLKVS